MLVAIFVLTSSLHVFWPGLFLGTLKITPLLVFSISSFVFSFYKKIISQRNHFADTTFYIKKIAFIMFYTSKTLSSNFSFAFLCSHGEEHKETHESLAVIFWSYR